jgi:hypothetical protein
MEFLHPLAEDKARRPMLCQDYDAAGRVFLPKRRYTTLDVLQGTHVFSLALFERRLSVERRLYFQAAQASSWSIYLMTQKGAPPCQYWPRHYLALLFVVKHGFLPPLCPLRCRQLNFQAPGSAAPSIGIVFGMVATPWVKNTSWESAIKYIWHICIYSGNWFANLKTSNRRLWA